MKKILIGMAVGLACVTTGFASDHGPGTGQAAHAPAPAAPKLNLTALEAAVAKHKKTNSPEAAAHGHAHAAEALPAEVKQKPQANRAPASLNHLATSVESHHSSPFGHDSEDSKAGHGRSPAVHGAADVTYAQDGFDNSVEKTASPAPTRLTIAMNNGTGKPVFAREVFTAGKAPVTLVDKYNAQIELAPYSVVEFSEEAELRLMRGSALVVSRGERSLRTSTAQVDFNGRVLVSYDFKQKSSSAFVVEGEARMLNPAEPESSLRLERFRGATLEVGGVVPQLVRQLDLASVRAWMKGYAWPETTIAHVVSAVPETTAVADNGAPTYLEDAKIEDYFSAIDVDDDSDKPDYYERKFSDPEKAVAEAKATKPVSQKGMSPEEAALITLPNTKIDLGFEVIGANEKDLETFRLGKKAAPAAKRGLASVPAKRSAPSPVVAPAATSEEGAVSEVLQRLRNVRPKEPVVSSAQELSPGRNRGPASIGSGVVPDPVYDYSENF